MLHKNKHYMNAFKNVDYNTHPEEICAEHFRLMVMGFYNKNIFKKLPDKEMMEDFQEAVSSYFFLENKRNQNNKS